MNMEPLNQKSLERVVSQKALQIGSSFPCQICVVGFLSGVCLTSLFLALLTSLGTFEFGGISFSAISQGNSPLNSSSSGFINTVANADCKFKRNEVVTEGWVDSKRSKDGTDDERVSILHSAWSALLSESVDGKNAFWYSAGLDKSAVPNAPHLENCKLSEQTNERLDKRTGNERLPPWTTWKGLLDTHPASMANEQLKYLRHQAISEGAYPPWITGSDEENYPLTRKVQRDIWLHQHPENCRDPNIRFLVAEWERLPGFGIGAQLAGMCGLLAIAINEKRVLVTNYYNRADHDGCKGSYKSSWSCYFFPETSQECRDRAFELLGNKEALERGIVTTKDNYTSKEIWTGRTPRVWGEPWSFLQPTTEINGSLVAFHRKMDRRWWRAQAIRYLMRFQTQYMCGLMNSARHAAFGKEAAKMVLTSLGREWPKDFQKRRSDIEEFVWSSHRPWIPRPLLSMHVRMGDKACEMKVVEFEGYMHLAGRIRQRFPHPKTVWLSTEMQEVVDKSKQYTKWEFYYTNVRRQVGNMTMAIYEASLGRQTSTNYPLVNFLMATEADFFVGALGSTWCYLIDGMRNTGGKVMAGYLSVNKDRFW
ncbi:PREDICTED: uncharacterized protein LOC105133878 [Populus euphratica]|uniref:Uncharacterized protein LOC105133878 n=1 Tax=Populus euphratica TaxID=75702 RepID=A0AAJ6XZ99_POPEU|nr:PREDICTED: uncharacterized protein LOC105133878 [Populus euphratica]XP_011036323.1 PREDICTED: uncharacterized protein LOC105133878 [Populus euphratica]XP_011036324.1 PREDICTED: uncharacterized protein LOC105133878 [Populus euphratica]XP_011036325.1 PREDICTED: uncharacterized protein LOC105133878 [Populus euphratica]XP_011036327.1 PREDICTED: uncharacterized protein LOC105133878 [Populus euphratica]XP_011036328.1 PREDICTED: uncharacterized protein LOC105133878 [Populus euphratica]